MGAIKQYLAVVAAASTIGAYACLLGDRRLVMAVAGKERLLEDLSAWLMLAASGVSFAAWAVVRRRSASRRRAGYLLLGLFFFVAFGEELSWGQQVFRFETPESIRAANQQNEVNLHNLEIFDSHSREGRKTGLAALVTSNRLFDYFMVTSFLLLPLAARRAGVWLRARGVPVVSLWLALPLLLNFGLTIVAEQWLVVDVFTHLAVSETREFGYAVLCLAGMTWLLAAEVGRVDEDAGGERSASAGEDLGL